MKKILTIYFAISLIFSNLCFSKVTPKNGEDKIIIKKGDTLWKLARKYYNDPGLWSKFNEYNLIDNPDLIQPGERLAIGKDLALSLASAMKGRMKRLEGEKGDLRKKILDLKKEKENLIRNYEKKIADLKKGLPTDDELRLKHQTEIEVMENEILTFQNKLVAFAKDKGSIEGSLSVKIVELEEKKKEIKGKGDEIALLEDTLQLRDDEIVMLKTGIFELEEKLKIEEEEITKRDKKIEKLKDEKGLYTGLSHFLIFALVSGIFALNIIN